MGSKLKTLKTNTGNYLEKNKKRIIKYDEIQLYHI